MTLAKIVHMLDRAWDDELLDGFLALETWGNDNVAFPGECYRRYIEELYQRDKLAQAASSRSPGGRRASRPITCPTLAVTFEHDNIVPWESAKELVDLRVVERQGLAAPAGRSHRRRGVEERVEGAVAEDRRVVGSARRARRSARCDRRSGAPSTRSRPLTSGASRRAWRSARASPRASGRPSRACGRSRARPSS